MAQLNSLIVTGPSRFLNKLMATEIQATQLNVADKLSVTSSVFTYNSRKVMTGSSVGNSTTPVYIDANGYPVAISSYGGTAASAVKANYLNLYEARGTTTTLNKPANYVAAGAMFHLIASSSTTNTAENGKTPDDANILQMNWDNNGGYDSQMGISTSSNRMFYRSMASQKTAWREVASIAASTQTGSATKGVYVSNSGKVTAMTYALNATINAGAANKLAYYSGANAISQYTSTVGTATKGVYMNAGWPTAMTYELKATLNNATQWGVAYYSTATNVTSTAAGTAGYLLQGNGAAAPSWIQATSANTANTIVKRDGSGNFSAGTITASLNGNAATATNADKVDGYHMGEAEWKYSNTYNQPTAGEVWYLKIQTPDWNNISETIYLVGSGQNKRGVVILKIGSRNSFWWGYAASYNGTNIVGVKKVVSASHDVYIKMDASCTQVTIKTTFSPRISTSTDTTGYTNVPSNGGLFGNNITVGTIYGALSGNASTATKLATARSITIGATSKTFDGTTNISYTPYEMRLVRALYGTDSNLNAFANHGHALGMCSLGDNGSVDNPGGKTGWHHVINLTWNDTADNNNNTANEWCTQIANACGSSDLYVRSRAGGSITNGTAWTAPWTKILTAANYTGTLDSRYVNVTGDTMTGTLTAQNIIPSADNTYNIGVASTQRWKNVYAVTFHGALSGNASSATKATQDSLGQNISDTYIKSIGYIAHATQPKLKYTKGSNGATELNMPIASATNAGLITTGTQTLAGDKTLVAKLLIETTGTSSANKSSTFRISSSESGAGTDIGMEFWRGTNASWQIVNSGGNLYFKTNYTGSTTDSYSLEALKLNHTTGASRVPYLGINGENTNYRLYVNGTSYLNGNTTHNGILYFANGTTYYINNSGTANLNELTTNSTTHFKKGIRIGDNANGDTNYICFYGTTGDGPGSFNHTYIGENRYGDSESSELLLFKGNDMASGTSMTAVAGPGPDRIRMVAAGHLFQTYETAVSGTWTTVCDSTAPKTRFEIFRDGTRTHGTAYFASGSTYYINNNADAKLRYLALGGLDPTSSYQLYVNGTSWIKGNLSTRHLYPEADSTYDIGSTTYHWRYGYFDGLYISSNTSYSAWNSAANGVFINTDNFGIQRTSAGGGFYVYSNGIQVARMYLDTLGTAGDGTNAGALGSARLVLGNSTARSSASGAGANNTRGILQIYSQSNRLGVEIWGDNEGGNIQIYSPSQTYYTNASNTTAAHFWQMDSHNGNLRFYNYYGGSSTAASAYRGIYIERTGTIFPNDNNIQNLGTSSKYWANAYVTTINGTTFTGNAATATKLATARTIWGQSFNGTANISGNMTGVGNINTAAAPAGTIYMNNWFRSTGATGWYNETHGGGWYMTDNTYIRNFNSKTVRLDNLCLGADNNSYRLYVNGTSYFTNYLQTTSYFKSTIATGTAPVQVTSTTLNTNLNADLLDGWHKQDILGTYYVTSPTANLSHYWCKIWNATVTVLQANDIGITIYAQNHFTNQYGLFSWRIRQEGANNSGAYNFAVDLKEHFGNISNTDIRLYYNNSTGVCEVWVNCASRWGVWNYTVLKKCFRTAQDNISIGTFYNNNFSTAQTMPTSPYITASYTLDGRYIKKSGDTMTGHLNATAGLSWNNVSWSPSGNITCTPTANNQEWSIDIGGGSYTGSYFQVWSKKNNGPILECYDDDRHVRIPGVLYIGSNNKISLWEDGEGGNIRIYSPSQTYYSNSSGATAPHFWEADSHNGDLRFYNYYGGSAAAASAYKAIVFKRNGGITSDGKSVILVDSWDATNKILRTVTL